MFEGWLRRHPLCAFMMKLARISAILADLVNNLYSSTTFNNIQLLVSFNCVTVHWLHCGLSRDKYVLWRPTSSTTVFTDWIIYQLTINNLFKLSCLSCVQILNILRNLWSIWTFRPLPTCFWIDILKVYRLPSCESQAHFPASRSGHCILMSLQSITVCGIPVGRAMSCWGGYDITTFISLFIFLLLGLFFLSCFT